MTGIVVRAVVPSLTRYSEYKEYLRVDFWFSCAYCTTSEVEAGGVRFTIDHYWSRKRCPALENEYTNLMWACDHCNEYKWTRPTDAELRKGYRLFHPDGDNPGIHFALRGTGVEPLTEFIGKYTCEVLSLNRMPLRKLRETRQRLTNSRAAVFRGMRALDGVQLETLPLEIRAKFMMIRERLSKHAAKANDRLTKTMLSEFNRSQMLDEDPTAGAATAQRRKYLSKLNAPDIVGTQSGAMMPKAVGHSK